MPVILMLNRVGGAFVERELHRRAALGEGSYCGRLSQFSTPCVVRLSTPLAFTPVSSRSLVFVPLSARSNVEAWMDRAKWIRRLPVVVVLGLCVALAFVVVGGAAGSDERFLVPHTRQGAGRDVEIVLGSVVLPSGAVRLAGEPLADGEVLGLSGPRDASGDSVDRHVWWRVPGGWRSVLAFVRAHPPRGSREFVSGSGETGGRETVASITFAWPVSPGEVRTRQLSVLVATKPGARTFLRVDARVTWLVLRPVTERVPDGVREIDIERFRPPHARARSLTVTDISKVDAIVARVDRLPILQPEGAIVCPDIRVDEPLISFVFRAAPGGAVLAAASEMARSRGRTSACDAMSFSVRGVPQRPLLEGPRVVAEAERLLGAKL
jgi:hypothetical protein